MNYQNFTLTKDKYKAVIFDMDGVVTDTAEVHAECWKRLFDDYLKERAEKLNEPFVPFDSNKDYGAYVDGKPRFSGVMSFLESRGISLPKGNVDDGDDKETIYGLGNRKNTYFNDYIREHGVKVFPSTVELIRNLKQEGISVAIITSSKNSEAVLTNAGVLDLFEVRVDGNYSEKHNIKGKPQPDIFIEAAKLLGMTPEESVVVEDAQAGVEAGRRGNFALVIGVDRLNQPEKLKKMGADVVVKDLKSISVGHVQLKNALTKIDEIIEKKGKRELAIFLDYDGTLTPIVARPELAILSEKTKDELIHLKKHYFVAIISGRDREDVQKLVGIEGLIFAGSHGFDIKGPNHAFQNEMAVKCTGQLQQAAQYLESALKEVEGAIVEKKRFGVAAHYRQVSENDVLKVKDFVMTLKEKLPLLKLKEGKKVFEFLPNVDWNKGKALEWVMKKLNMDEKRFFPIYIGDDKTDEDAFYALQKRGIGILVHDEVKPTFATYFLKNPEEVGAFLKVLTEIKQDVKRK